MNSSKKKCKVGVEKPFESRDENTVAVGTALENHLILKEIFSYLSPADLKSCCEVNEIWRSVADPMIVCHDVVWFRDDLMVDEITRGHVHPEVEKKTWRVGMTGEMTRLLEERGDRGRCIRLTVKHVDSIQKKRAFEFYRTFGHRVFALTYNHGYWFDYYLGGQDWGLKGTLEEFLKILTEFFPNLEELFLPELRWKTKKRIGHLPSFPPLTQLRKVDFGFRAELTEKAGVEVMKVMPNVEEIENFPVTVLKILQDSDKFHTVRSIQFSSTYDIQLGDRALQSLVDMGLRFRSLVVGKKLQDWSNLMYIQRNKARFECLLELGKDSLEHLVLPPLEQIGFLNFPPKMTAVSHLSFRGKLSSLGIRRNRRYFPDEFDLLGTFPNLKKVSIHDKESAVLRYFSFPKKTFGVEKLGDAVKILQVPSEMDQDLVNSLKRLFPHVERVECVEFDLEFGVRDPYGRGAL